VTIGSYTDEACSSELELILTLSYYDYRGKGSYD